MTNAYSWYATLQKPSWAPPSWLFGPVWTVLYFIIFVSFGTVFYKIARRELPLIVALPFILNLIANASFTYFQFGLRNNLLAAVDATIILTTLVWAMIALAITSLTLHLSTGSPSLMWIVYANIPYFLWVCFATVLQFTITYMNR